MQADNVTFEVYRAIEAINYSTLKHMRKSPLHYRHAVDMPDEDTIGRLKGRATHTALLEPHLFESQYPVFGGKRRAGKEWEQFELEHAGKCILKVDERDSILRVRDAVMRHPIAARYFEGGEREVSLVWNDAATGLACKARLDMRNRAAGVIVDLKSCATLDKRRFEMTAGDQGYHGQMSWYQTGHFSLNQNESLQCVLIAMEHSPPYDIGVFSYDLAALVVGERENAALLQRVRECRKSGEWPGRFAGETMITLPSYLFPSDDELDINTAIDAAGCPF